MFYDITEFDILIAWFYCNFSIAMFYGGGLEVGREEWWREGREGGVEGGSGEGREGGRGPREDCLFL